MPNPANPQAYNRYSYVENRPLNLIDPSGHLANCALLGASEDIQGCQNPPPPQPETKAGKPSLIKEATPFDRLPFDLFGENGDPIYDGSRVQGFGDTTLSSTRRDYSLFGFLHPGIDIPMEPGTELLALGDGIVWCAGGGETYCGQTDKSGGFGVGIKYPSCSCIVYYVHAVDVSVKVGAPVVAGQVVAASGTGSDGYAHLHLEIRSVRNDMVYNPLHFFQQDTWNSINLQYQSYQNSYANPEARVYSIMMQTGFDYWNWEGSHPFVFVK